MRGVALMAPVMVLGMVHLLQRLEVWATDTRPRTIRRMPAAVPLEAETSSPSLRRLRVSQRRPEGKASEHG